MVGPNGLEPLTSTVSILKVVMAISRVIMHKAIEDYGLGPILQGFLV